MPGSRRALAASSTAGLQSDPERTPRGFTPADSLSLKLRALPTGGSQARVYAAIASSRRGGPIDGRRLGRAGETGWRLAATIGVSANAVGSQPPDERSRELLLTKLGQQTEQPASQRLEFLFTRQLCPALLDALGRGVRNWRDRHAPLG